jgi:energy-coupling factor transporter ATP-binding protein EcfA2
VASGIDLRGLRLERDGPDGPRLVVDGVDVVLAPGRRLALIGGNGSGKSTVLRHLAVPGVIPGRAAIVFQDPDEQLVAGAVAAEFALGAGPDAADTVTAWAAPFGLEAHLGLDARLLSAGQKQRLQLALALRSDPDLLLLDEPTSLQDETGAAWLRERLAAWPGAMVWATQRRDEAALCHDALVLRDGRPWREGPVGEVLADPDVQGILDPERLVDPGESGPPAGAGDGEPVCVVDDVSLAFAAGGGLGPVSLAVHAGDRLGVTGPNGCGKSTLLAAMAGLRRPDGGQVTLAGRPLYRHGDTDLDHGAAALAPPAGGRPAGRPRSDRRSREPASPRSQRRAEAAPRPGAGPGVGPAADPAGRTHRRPGRSRPAPRARPGPPGRPQGRRGHRLPRSRLPARLRVRSPGTLIHRPC